MRRSLYLGILLISILELLAYLYSTRNESTLLTQSGLNFIRYAGNLRIQNGFFSKRHGGNLLIPDGLNSSRYAGNSLNDIRDGLNSTQHEDDLLKRDGLNSTKHGDDLLKRDSLNSTRHGDNLLKRDDLNSTINGDNLLKRDGLNSTRHGDNLLKRDGLNSTQQRGNLLIRDGNTSTQHGDDFLLRDGLNSTQHGDNLLKRDGLNFTRHGGGLLMPNGTLSIALNGRLGNQMFQYASILGLGDIMNFSNIVIKGGDDLLSSFQLSDKRVSFSQMSLNASKHVNEMHSNAFDKRLTMFSNKEDITVGGYLQSWKYFNNIQKHVRKEFSFVPSIFSKAKQIKLDITSQFNGTSTLNKRTYIGVHIRRGDFLQESKIEFGHFPVTKAYIFHALHQCNKMFGEDIIFVFCSDDIRWVKDTFSNNTYNWKMAFVEGNAAAVDMAVLSLCDHTIVTTGSFGWWAAWLAGGKTIISKQQVRDGSYLSTQFVYSDYFYPDWVVIE